MIDIHSHIVYGIDDGPPTIEESISMVKEAEKLGVKVIIATSHCKEPGFPDEKYKEHYNKLVESCADVDVTIKMGYEVLIGPHLLELTKEKASITLDGSKYMLLEFPIDNDMPMYTLELIYKLQLEGIIIIIAHPERNKGFVRNINSLVDLVERGCLVQIDSASIIGKNGRNAKRMAKRLVKLRMAHFVSSDAHCLDHYAAYYIKSYECIRKWAGEEYAEKLFIRNAKNILGNIQESIYEMV